MAAIFVGDNLRIEAVYEDKGSSVCAVITTPTPSWAGT
jgi:hypothetical protein